MLTGPRHAGPRRHTSRWAGAWPPLILLALVTAFLVWELSWTVPLIWGEA